MNKQRREKLARIIKDIEAYYEDLEYLCDEIKDEYNELSDEIMESEEGEKMMEAADSIKEEYNCIEGIVLTSRMPSTVDISIVILKQRTAKGCALILIIIYKKITLCNTSIQEENPLF